MPQARLTINIPESVWIHDISTSHPDIVFHVQTVLTAEDTGIGLVELHTTDPLPLIQEIENREDIVDLELLWKHEDQTLIQIRTSDPLLLVPIWRAGVPLQLPFEIQDGTATWEVTTSSERLSAFGGYLDDLDIQYTVEHVLDINEGQVDRLLTNRQQELVRAALQRGYYESPRKVSLTDIAEQLDVAKSTCSDVLHRAESNVMHWFFDNHMMSNHTTGLSNS